MAGLGVSRSAFEIKADILTEPIYKRSSPTKDKLVLKSKSLTNLAYQIGLGANYKVTHNIYLDCGYKFTGIRGKYILQSLKRSDTVLDNSSREIGNPKPSHYLTVGIRFVI